MAFKKTFVLSDESVNCYGFKILTAGIDLTQANKNLPAFYNHETWSIPLGHWENLRVKGKQLLGDLVIEGENEEEKEYIRKIQNGDIKGASGGFDPLAWNEEPAQLSQGQTRPTLEKCVLFEASITPIPGNNNALSLVTKDGMLKLSAPNINLNNIVPELKSKPDMKQIALKLGLAETATEQQILDAVAAIQLGNANAEALRLHVEAQAAEELATPEAKELFTQLSKSNVNQALSFLKLSRKPVEAPATETTTATGTITKDVTLSSIVKDAMAKNAAAAGAEDGKDSYDYLQKKNPAELARIHKEDPERYTQLSKAYGEGVRYTGK